MRLTFMDVKNDLTDYAGGRIHQNMVPLFDFSKTPALNTFFLSY